MSVSKLVLGMMLLMTAGCQPCCYPGAAAKPPCCRPGFTPETPDHLEVAKPTEPKQ